MIENPNKISQIQVGSVTYDIHDARALPSNADSSYALAIKNQYNDDILTVDWDGTVDIGPQELTDSASGFRVHGSNLSTASQTASANLYGLIAGSFDSGGNIRSYIKHVDLANGRQGVEVETRRVVNGSNVYNNLQMHIAADGTRAVSLSDRAAWLSALGYTAPTNLSLNSACTAYDSAGTPKYARDGHVVSVWGTVKPTAEVAAGGTMTIGTLPTGFRPPNDIRILCQGSGTAK